MSKKPYLPHKQKDGTYRARVPVGKRDGRTLYKDIYGKTERECRQKAKPYLDQRRKDIEIRKDNTLQRWVDEWLDLQKNLQSRTYYDELRFDLNRASELFDMDIQSISKNDVLRCFAGLSKKFSHNSIRKTRNALSRVFEYAMDDNAVDTNVVARVNIRSLGKTSKTKKPLTNDQIEFVKETNDRCQTFAMICLFSGLRKEECLALTAEDLHLDCTTPYISVNKVDEVRFARIRESTKSESGTRDVPIPSILVNYLREQKFQHKYIAFDSEKPIGSSSYQRWWKSYMTKMDASERRLEPFTSHQLRHTYATWLYDFDVDEKSSMLLMGHSDITMTRDLYAHLSKDRRDKSVDNLMSGFEEKFKDKTGQSQEATDVEKKG